MKELLAKLIEAGTPAELVAEVAIELSRARAEHEALERKKEQDRERQRRRRESRNVTESHVTQRDKRDEPSPKDNNIQTPTREEKPKPNGLVKKTGKGFRLPVDWEPEQLVGKAAAMVAAWQPGAMERELAKFKNYWLSKGANAARTDWQRTWVNWLISADEKQPRQTDERSFEQLFAERFGGNDAGNDAAPHSPDLDDAARSASMGGGRGWSA